MAYPRNISLYTAPTIYVALDLLDQRKDEPCFIVESEQSTPEEKYEALVALAYMTGILTSAAAEAA
jgi:hypothetical protein